jgi:MprA protease rhombosortase-interaction domain-containing protein
LAEIGQYRLINVIKSERAKATVENAGSNLQTTSIRSNLQKLIIMKKTPLTSLFAPIDWKNAVVFAAAAFVLANSSICSSHAQISLLNVNFHAHMSPGLNAVKIGPAVLSLGGNDFWNHYSRDGANGNWQPNGSLANLKLADGVSTSVGLVVNNASGAWANGSGDPMYNTYLYPFSGLTTLSLNNLPAGSYDLLIYSYDANFQLSVGGTGYGSKASYDPNRNGLPVWQEGRQYVRFNGLDVNLGETLSVIVSSGQEGYATFSGLQLVAVPEPATATLLLLAGGLMFAARRNVTV